MATSSTTDLWDALVGQAAAESPLWAESALPGAEQRREPVFSVLCEPKFALGVETIYEGYLLHFGRPRLFAPGDADTALLLGDYLYAHGLVRVAATGSTAAVHDLAELISLCSQAQADETDGDWAAWAATSSALGSGTLEAPRARLRELRDPAELEGSARATAGDDAVDRARAAHSLHMG